MTGAITPIVAGRTASGQDLCFDPVAGGHTLFTGRTRSGKSSLLYSLLVQLRGKPVKVCGADPSGVLFSALGEGLGGADLRALTLRNPQRIQTVFSDLVELMDERISELLSARRDKFTDFSVSFPLVIVLVEELPGLLGGLEALDKASGAKSVDRVELTVRAALQRLALEGHKVGLRVWLVSQRADATILGGVLRAQLTAKFSFAQDQAGLKMLHEDLTPEQIASAAQFLPGQGFAEIAGFLPLTLFRADYCSYDQLANFFDPSRVAASSNGAGRVESGNKT